jgi:hypothetical protein
LLHACFLEFIKRLHRYACPGLPTATQTTSGSGPSTVASRAWQVSDVAALTRPRSALGLSTTGGGGKLAGGKFCKGGSGINLAATVDAGGVGTEMLLAGGDQDDDDCCPTCLDLYTSGVLQRRAAGLKSKVGLHALEASRQGARHRCQ